MSHFVPQEFHYRLGWRASGARPGAHLTRTPGGVADFRGYAPFLDNPDPRRVDPRASLATLPRRLMVRAYHERGAIAVYAIVDLSASMRFSGVNPKFELAADIAASVAWSATCGGDVFGMVACDDAIRMDMVEIPTHRRGAAAEVRQRLLACPLRSGIGATALPLAAEHLRRARSLVFLISDFHFEEALLRATLQSLALHDVVPVVLWDSAEYDELPRWGWARVRDMESGGEHSLFMRPVLAERIRTAYRNKCAALASACRVLGARPPFFVNSRFQAEHLARHMLETC